MAIIHVTAPPSKSVSHRALIAAALSNGRSIVRNSLESVDLNVTRSFLQNGGAQITGTPKEFEIIGIPGGPKGGAPDAPVVMDMHESGTSCRILTAIAAAGNGTFEICGAPRMHERPIGELVLALYKQGVRSKYLQKDGCPPLRLHTVGLSGGEVNITMEESSQYLSGLLMAAPLAENSTVITVRGKKAVSWPYVGLTLAMMEKFGISFAVQTFEGDPDTGKWLDADWKSMDTVVPNKVRFVVEPGWYAPQDVTVEGDWSNASYFLAAGAIKGPLQINGLHRDSAQGDKAMLSIMETMGISHEWNTEGNAVTVLPGQVKGAELDMNRCPDIVPTVAILASFAKGETVIRNVAHLRIKESDRLEATAQELRRAGCGAEVFEDGIRIIPAPLAAGKSMEFCAHNDHRMAMSTSLFELAGIRVSHDNPGCVSKSFPTFFDEWENVRRAL